MIELTALVGSVGEEFNCLPVENEEFRMLSEKKALEALKPKRETVFIDKVPGKLLQARNLLPGEKSAFVVCFPLSHYCFTLARLIYSTASDKGPQAQTPGEQVYAYAAERAAGPDLPVFPRIQILAVQEP